MGDMMAKFRMRFSILRLRLKFFWSEITTPFRIVTAYVKRYSELKKIDEESEDRWERHVKKRALEQKDEQELRRSQFFLKKTQVVGTFFRTSMNASCYFQYQENTTDFESYRAEFFKKKAELVRLINELEEYPEITFDEEFKKAIADWEFDQFETQEEMGAWLKRFSEYIPTLDII